MLNLPIYMDNHATTRLDPRVLEAMLPYFTETFGNAGSTTHTFGHAAKEAVDTARGQIAGAIGANPKEIVFTSGATESNNLAIKGVAAKHAHRGKHIISVTTEHPAVLDPLKSLARHGFEVTLLPVTPSPNDRAGLICVEQVAEALRDDTILVSVMLANNEIGAIQPVAEIGRLCRQRGVLLHTDATQAVGKMPVDVEQLQVDLMSFSAHKMYGPKGIGALYVRRGRPPVRLEPLIDGGGQEGGLRSGTLNTPGIVGFARALQLCLEELPAEAARLRGLRDRLYAGLTTALGRTSPLPFGEGPTLSSPLPLGEGPGVRAAAEPGVKNGILPPNALTLALSQGERGLSGVSLNGPSLALPELRLPGNLNVSFANVDGETLLVTMRDIALSSGSACTSANPEPSHVLRSLGLADEAVRSSVRFGLGRFNTAEEVEFTIARTAEKVANLRAMISVVE